MIYKSFPNGRFYNADTFDAMRDIPSGIVDMVLCDLPYGTTQNKWDSVIPFDQLWNEYWRICKPNAAVVLTAAQPFTSALVMSQIEHFKYDWVWQKDKGTGHLNAKIQPMRDKEDICVFYRKQCVFNPQFSQGVKYDAMKKVGKNQLSDNYGNFGIFREENNGKRYPKQVLKFTTVQGNTIHPTQKPVDLFEYLIRTYTNEGALVVDNTAGSGTTAIAAINTNRRWCCIEKSEEYFTKAMHRITQHMIASK